MKLLLCIVFAALSLQAAAITAAQSGSWSSTSTWTGGVIPGNGDTVSIPNGITVTVTDTRTVGTSGVAGTNDLNLNSSGALVIASGGTLHMRGGVIANGVLWAGVAFNQLTVQAGGIFEFDASAASSPSTAIYTYGSTSGSYDITGVSATGTSGSHAIIRSNPGGAAGQFVNVSNNVFSFSVTYTDFARIGDATHNGWVLSWDYGYGYGAWNVTHSTFTSCGPIQVNGLDAGNTFIHDYNVHASSAQSEVVHNFATTSTTTTGTREVKGNVFDVSMSRTYFYPIGFTITGNYMGDATATGSTGAATDLWTKWDNNLMRYTDYWGSNGAATGVTGQLTNSYIFLDTDWGNPKPIAQAYAIRTDLIGLIVGQAGTAYGPPGVTDSGELWWNSSSPATTPYGIYNSIILPNMAGYSSMEMGSITTAFTNLHAIAEHNTWFGGFGPSPTTLFPAVQLGEGGSGSAGVVSSFRGNILWNPQLASYTSAFFKLADLSYAASPTTDYCAPANCDYNTGWGHTLTNAAQTQYTNQGKGYAGKFSSTPGVHDVDVNPQFVDYQRNLELFDSKYLGNSPTTWSSGTTYNVGDFVKYSQSTVYWSLPVDYRYINASGCGSTNPAPGSGTNWRSCWEWASLYRIRQAVAAGTLVNGSDYITTLINWIRAGYAPTNPAIVTAAFDGQTIGAVNVAPAVKYQTIIY